MATDPHLSAARHVQARTQGCEECLALGIPWVHLRVCLSCGHVGCCDSSIGRHATKHFLATQHPIIESFEPNETWGWCYIEEHMLELPPELLVDKG
ncbi:MAG: UBP-type zinc finger domain-containing protein [Deltaproteobacteria bacterium]|nr:UBP-type zinc finger domain-containing protein [Deltaproteobacteria bacterium]MCW5805755.1 UBP-type zinc finger domain-containing protein [Deltaproteobacteria bacterium]